jgi:hypothetical protein
MVSSLESDPPPAIDRLSDVDIAMRDGIRLSANIYLPSGSGRWPVLLVRTPYGKGADLYPSYRIFIDRGYAVVVQDVRGRYQSEGVFRPLVQEGPDGEDTLNWIGRQSWCDGNIGMLGGSYIGIAQWQAALRGSPYLKAIFPVVSGYDDYLDRFYSRGGAMKWGHRLMWIAQNLRAPGFRAPAFNRFVYHLPPRTADRAVAGRTVEFYQDAVNHPAYDTHWRSISTREKLDRIRVPVFVAGGWFDNFGQSDLEAFAALRELGRKAHVLMGPWAHNFADPLGVSFGPESSARLRRIQLAWFDHWLKGRDTIVNLPPARVFTMGENRWRDLDSWPPGEAETVSFYLDGKGKANASSGDGRLEIRRPQRGHSDHFVYDPRSPVPTHGGPVCCNARALPPGPMDQRDVEQRPDVLVYSTQPLKDDVEVTGVVRLLVWVSTSARDTDFTAKLVDVAPEGLALNVTDGILRLRYRKGLDRPELAEPGKVYPILIDLGVTSHVFAVGHQIRLEVSSSNFPRFDRNPNTGRTIANEVELRVANQTVYHGGKQPSALLLPLMPRTAVARSRYATRRAP